MKVAFNIRRSRWFRLLSSVIDESLANKFEVYLLLHSYNTDLKENCANINDIPNFSSGKVKIIEFENSNDLIVFIENCRPMIIVDIMPPDKLLLKQFNSKKREFYWVVLDGNPMDVSFTLNNEDQLYACDMFAMKTKLHIDEIINNKSIEKQLSKQYLKNNIYFINDKFRKFYNNSFKFQWNDSQKDYFQSKSVIIGTPCLDALHLISNDEIRDRLRIKRDKKIVVLLPCPFGTAVAWCSLWERLFMSKNILEKLYWRINSLQFYKILKDFNSPIYMNILHSINKFCRNNNALLIAKVKQNTILQKSHEKYIDYIIGEESFHPHMSIKLFSIADLVIGFYSTGAVEAVAANSYYLNINIPNFPKTLYSMMQPIFKTIFEYPGASYSMDAIDVENQLPKMILQDFVLNETSQNKFIKDHVGRFDGKTSKRFIDALYYLVQNARTTNHSK